jgi:hypothetical protein
VNVPSIAKKLVKLTDDNLPTVLSAAAVVGTAATVYLTGKATFKAAELIHEEQEKRNLHEIEELRVLPTMDKVKLVWVQYLPAAGTTIATIGCIVFANRISATRLAAVAAAYSASEKRFGEYKQKVTEKLGINKEQAARDELAQERVNANPPSGQTIIMGGGDSLFQDVMSGRYFMSDMESVRKAVNDLNERMMHEMTCTLTEYYGELGLEKTKISDEVGWDVSNGPIELRFSTALADNNRPCIVVDFYRDPAPIRGHSFSG